VASSRTSPHEPDHVDELIEQWGRERPDLELEPMALIGRLGRVSTLVTRAVEAGFAEHGISVGEFDVLAALRRSGEPFRLRPTDLSRWLMLSPAGMTNRLDRLESAGWVQRVADPADRRSTAVQLTEPGRQLIDRAVTDHLANEARIVAALDDADRKALDRSLRTLLRHLASPR
jgi:DNA-binding MarR family transcriptional regulator